MIGIQIISITFTLIVLYFTYLHFRRKDFSGKEFLFWIVIWIGFLGVCLFPGYVSPHVQSLGFARLMDFVIVIALVLIFGVLFHNYFVVRKMEKRIEALVRKLALKDLDDQ